MATVILYMYVKSNVGKKIDEYNGVTVYNNGYVWNTEGRNQTKDGYNIGLKYQCVEFVKRYYLERFRHKMPNTSGNAVDFFDKKLRNGELNSERDLFQYINGEGDKPQIDDIIIFTPTIFNKYGHIAIVSASNNDFIEIVQQNPGLFSFSREKFNLIIVNQKYFVNNKRVLGWLRKKSS